MRKLMLIPAMLLFSSCTSIETAREKLATMDSNKYMDLIRIVTGLAYTGGQELGSRLDDATKQHVVTGVTVVVDLIKTDSVTSITKVIEDLLAKQDFKFVEDAALNNSLNGALKDSVKALNALVGDIRLGIDGKLSLREKELILVLLESFTSGLQNP